MTKMIKINFSKFILIALTLFYSNAHAWESRGHAIICDTAIALIKDPDFKMFLLAKSSEMEHLCNIPDSYWKSLDSSIKKIGAPTHFLDTEHLQENVAEIFLDYSKIQEKYLNQKSNFDNSLIQNIPSQLGSLWWRVDQFFRLSLQEKKVFENPYLDEKIKNLSKQAQEAFFRFYVNLGLMGHFVGDNSQPMHLSADYDGKNKGHPGLHSYYEGYAVNYLGSELKAWVETEALKQYTSIKRKYQKDLQVVSAMRDLGALSYSEYTQIIKADELESSSDADEVKRKPIEKTIKNFKPLIVRQLARASVYLAVLWQSAYAQIGSPNLKSYKIYDYAFKPEFVAPDYIEK